MCFKRENMQAKVLERTNQGEKGYLQNRDCLVFALIGDGNKIKSFVMNFNAYVYQMACIRPELKLGLPSKIQFKKRDGDIHTQSKLETDAIQYFSNQYGIDAVISFDLNEDDLSALKSRIGYSKYHPFFISYDKAADETGLAHNDNVVNARTDFTPYAFIKEIVDDFLPVNKELLEIVREKGVMLCLPNKSSDLNPDNCFATLPRDVINLILHTLNELEFKSDPCSFRFFTSEKHIRSLKQEKASNRLMCSTDDPYEFEAKLFNR